MSREFPKNPEPKIALPTVGRIVHVFGHTDDIGREVPLAGLVAGLCKGDGCIGDELRINVMVITSRGEPGSIQSLKHASLPRHSGEPYWDWMDYQKGQAAKTEELEAKLAKTTTLAQGGLIHGTHKEAAPGSHDSELGKLQAGAPSPVDGKR